MRYGKDFYINDSFVYNFSGFNLKKANYIFKLDNYPNPPKCRLFRTESAAIRFYKSLKERWFTVYEKYHDKWYQTFYMPGDNRFNCSYGMDVKIDE